MRTGRFYKSYILEFVFVCTVLFCFVQCRQNAAVAFKSQGGLRVMLEPDFRHLLRGLSENNPDEKFNRALDLAYARQATERRDFVELFVEEFKKLDANFRLTLIFATYQLREKVSAQSTNEEVILLLKDEMNDALDITVNGLAVRMESYGVNSHVEWLSHERRILVEIPGVEDPDRILNLLRNNADFGFWETYNLVEIYPQLMEADECLAKLLLADNNAVEQQTAYLSDKCQVSDSSKNELDALLEVIEEELNEKKKRIADYDVNHPLFAKLRINRSWGRVKMEDKEYGYIYSPTIEGELEQYSIIGCVVIDDEHLVMEYLNMPEIKSILPSDIVFKPEAKPLGESGYLKNIYALKKTNTGGPALNGDVITEAKVEFDEDVGFSISIQMNVEGSDTWAKVTRDNIGKSIAIVLNDKVYSAPIVQTEIIGGWAMIAGHFTKEEAMDLANMLNLGRMPLPVEISDYEVILPTTK